MKKNNEKWAEIGNRCRIKMDDLNMKQKDAAILIGVAQPIISSMWKGTRDPTRLVYMLSDKYGIPLDYLINGDNPNDAHYIGENTIDEKPYTTNSNGIRFFNRSDGKLLLEAPKVTRNALGSLDDEFADYSYDRNEGETELFEVNEVYHGKYYAFEVDGDSMDDDTIRGFQRGDVVLVRELRKDLWMPKLHINKWKFWVVVFGNNVRLKQIVAQDEEAGTITLHSLNPSPEYTDFTLNLEDVDRLFNVVLKKPKTQSYENF